jgi:hypothetical protein
MINLTLKDVLHEAHELVVILGDTYKYERVEVEDRSRPVCMYVKQTEGGKEKPSCLVGHILHSLGVSLDDLKTQEHKPASTALCNLRANGVVSVGEGVEDALSYMQNAQDVGHTWAYAVMRATYEASR